MEFGEDVELIYKIFSGDDFQIDVSQGQIWSVTGGGLFFLYTGEEVHLSFKELTALNPILPGYVSSLQIWSDVDLIVALLYLREKAVLHEEGSPLKSKKNLWGYESTGRLSYNGSTIQLPLFPSKIAIQTSCVLQNQLKYNWIRRKQALVPSTGENYQLASTSSYAEVLAFEQSLK